MLAATCLFAGCAGQESAAAAWEPIAAADLSPFQLAQEALATAARDAMIAELMSTLSGEITAAGPAAAIGVCKDKAPEIATSVGEQFGVRIGRVSHKLRNPSNTAPAWADALLADGADEIRRAVSPQGDLGVTLPIRVAGKCLLCHGPQDSLGEDVRAALASKYPHDQATGYSEGDLRGWFWVEVGEPDR